MLQIIEYELTFIYAMLIHFSLTSHFRNLT